ALEPNHDRVSGHFILNVLRTAFPGGLTNLALVLGVEAFVYAFGFSNEVLYTISTGVLLAVGLGVLWRVCTPFTPVHTVLWGSMAVFSVVGAVVFRPILGLTALNLQGMLVLLVFLALTIPTLNLMLRCFERGGKLLADAKHRLRHLEGLEPMEKEG
ncbi:MAG: cation-translocating P-type ATPase, partial [Gemmiger sp.]|nr:cation-translocating P-type ATPase [Gemmiger sp.]